MSHSPLRELLKCLPHSLLLENLNQEYQVLVPNHDAFHAAIADQPFSTYVTFNRGSLGWQEVMETRFYLYPVNNFSLTCLSNPVLLSIKIVK